MPSSVATALPPSSSPPPLNTDDDPRQNSTPNESLPESPSSPISPSPAEGISFSKCCNSSLVRYVEIVTESLPVTILMSLFTIWALFSDDIRMSASTKEADVGFMIVISIAFFLFSLELIAGCIYKENYLCLPNFTSIPNETWGQKLRRICNFGSFYFWLDLIATVSLIFEVCNP